MNTRYVVGFVFNKSMTRVALIRKNRPSWQAGKLNGIGGHIEERETAVKAMEREFYEETGVMINELKWEKVGVMYRDDEDYFQCHFFRYISVNEDIDFLAPGITDEKVEVHCLNDLSESLSNVPWLIGMCLDLNPGDFSSYSIKATIGKKGASK
jgi:8-oxo-dGTP diphosphatase